jgi:hypothetical protein
MRMNAKISDCLELKNEVVDEVEHGKNLETKPNMALNFKTYIVDGDSNIPDFEEKTEVVDQLEDGEIYELSMALNSETRDYIFSDSQ